MQQEIVITTQYLPSPEDVSEQAYQELVELLYQKQQELTQEWQVRYSDMMEYYTAWTHQMKTPIAAMRLHLTGGGHAGKSHLAGRSTAN